MFPFHRLLFWFSGSYREQSRTGIRHRNWVVPSEPGENGSRLVDLGRRNQKSEAARWLGKARRYGKDQRKSFNSAEGNYMVGLGKGFGAGGLYIDVRQCKGADNFAQERGFLVVGFDQGHMDFRGPEFDRDSGKSGAGTEVGREQGAARAEYRMSSGIGLCRQGGVRIKVQILIHRRSRE